MAKAGRRRGRNQRKTAGASSVDSSPNRVEHSQIVSTPGASRSSWIALAVIALAAFIAFAPAFRAPFGFDDVDSIPGNATIQHVFPLSSSFDPPARLAVSGRPLANFSLAVSYAMSEALGIDPRSTSDRSATVVYHVTNALIHLFCGLLLFGIIRRTASLPTLGAWANENAELLALVSSAIWLLHPIQTDAVDYVIQRTELLVSMCYLATLYASIRAWSSSKRRTAWIVVAIVACLAGMASKEVMVTAPFVVLLYDRTFRVSSWRALLGNRERRWLYVGLFATLLLLVALVAQGGRADSVGFGLALPWYQYFYSQGWAIPHYLQLMVWPVDLRFDYGFLAVQGIAPLIGGAAVLAIGGATLLVAIRRRLWWLAFLVVWFFSLLAPSSSVIPIQTEIAAERRVYLASAAVMVGVVVAIAHMLRARRRAFIIGSAIVAAMLLAVTARRSALYANPEALWRDAVQRVPNNPRAYDNLASVIYKKDRHRINEADVLWNRAIALDSTYMAAWSNLAQIRVDAGRTADARALLEHALRISPDYVDATRRLGGLLATAGDTKSIPYLERVASSPEATDETFAALGQAYVDANRPDDAINALRRALALNPHRADASSFLGAILAQRGQFDLALPYLESAVADGDQKAMTFALLSVGYAQAHRVDESVGAAARAAEHAGSDEQAFLLIGRAMLAIARPAEAEVYLTQATRAAPNDPEALTRLGVAKASRGDMNTAVELFRLALKIAPGYPPAAQALARAGAK